MRAVVLMVHVYTLANGDWGSDVVDYALVPGGNRRQ